MMSILQGTQGSGLQMAFTPPQIPANPIPAAGGFCCLSTYPGTIITYLQHIYLKDIVLNTFKPLHTIALLFPTVIWILSISVGREEKKENKTNKVLFQILPISFHSDKNLDKSSKHLNLIIVKTFFQTFNSLYIQLCY